MWMLMLSSVAVRTVTGRALVIDLEGRVAEEREERLVSFDRAILSTDGDRNQARDSLVLGVLLSE
jgi:hypothetical protein